MIEKMVISVDPRIKYNYANFYIKGLEMIIGSTNLMFKVEPFISLSYDEREYYWSGMPIAYQEQGQWRKIFIDFHDRGDIFEDRYEWADLYCKVNARIEDVNVRHKLMAIGPSFGLGGGHFCYFKTLSSESMEGLWLH